MIRVSRICDIYPPFAFTARYPSILPAANIESPSSEKFMNTTVSSLVKFSFFRRMFAAAICALATLFVTPAAQAASYQDLWWNPSESGWGVNVVQQGDILFATWFVYGPDGAPIWYVMSNGQKTAANVFTGRVFSARGTWFAAAWNPAALAPTDVGSATFTFTDKHTLSLRYSVGSSTVNKTLVRQSYAVLPIAGDFYGAEVGQPSNCANNQRYYVFALFNFTATTSTTSFSGPVTITQQTPDGTTCVLSGTHNQYGSAVEGGGNYTCNNGINGVWTFTDGQFNSEAFSLKISAALNNSTCRIDAVYSGTRN
jgi:hypothetical protein